MRKTNLGGATVAILGCLALAIAMPWLIVVAVRDAQGDVFAPVATGVWAGLPLVWTLILMGVVGLAAVGVLVFLVVTVIRNFRPPRP